MNWPLSAITRGSWFSRNTVFRVATVMGCAGFLVALTYVDWATGPDVHFSLLFVAPVMVAAWFVNRQAGYSMAVLFVVLRCLVDLSGVNGSVRPLAALWNSAVRMACLSAAVYWLSALKDLRTRLEALVEERTLAVRQMAAELSQAEAMERRRLAHDIHDGFSQTLSVLKLNLAAMSADQDLAVN